ncbi:MAG: carbon-nitrogen hydrolase family protein [Planctomycetes bacterium]|nr:carbon-nitrogen hydrolase family protein [Planctomycetota bacterium]
MGKTQKQQTTRRRFLQAASFGAGITFWNRTRADADEDQPKQERNQASRLPREVWIATISQNGLAAKRPEEMIRQMLRRMTQAARYKPDIICLPEVFPFVNLSGGRPPVADVAETPIGPYSEPFAKFARDHHCYVVCPVYTKHEGQYFNSAVFIDRNGRLLGEYHKIHPTIGEMDNGITPGPLDPPVFRTDFGIVGAQICFDIEWQDGWRKLSQSGAEVVFWPSAFAGGQAVNGKAWQNKYVVVSSTRKDTSKICDVTGEEIARTGRWDSWVCAPVNLEKVFLHTWPFCRRFQDIHAKYGRKVRIQTFHEEEWSVIESRSPDVRIADVMKEFDLVSYKDFIQAAETEQNERRPPPAPDS